MKEIEVKCRISDQALLKQRLSELGIVLSAPITQKDKVYFPKGIGFTGRAKAPALRIRENNGRFLFTYKIPLANNLDKLEYESGIDNPEAVASICEQLGFELQMSINKIRRKAEYKGYEICVDDVEGLGSYIEVEKLSADEDSEQIQNKIFTFMQTLGIQQEDRVFEGYNIMLFKKERGIA